MNKEKKNYVYLKITQFIKNKKVPKNESYKHQSNIKDLQKSKHPKFKCFK